MNMGAVSGAKAFSLLLRNLLFRWLKSGGNWNWLKISELFISIFCHMFLTDLWRCVFMGSSSESPWRVAELILSDFCNL